VVRCIDPPSPSPILQETTLRPPRGRAFLSIPSSHVPLLQVVDSKPVNTSLQGTSLQPLLASRNVLRGRHMRIDNTRSSQYHAQLGCVVTPLGTSWEGILEVVADPESGRCRSPVYSLRSVGRAKAHARKMAESRGNVVFESMGTARGDDIVECEHAVV
jgi:hypothetical protein